ncbi:Synaptogyrin-3 [Intoshia linei]|uniref:Synaptogyrin-3 n=1 Tax=Intoshia linei TaxID=1819745 RepID=A0A177AYB2_9BILA|nr:Synaptogyrin-3 [Intoshia linei]
MVYIYGVDVNYEYLMKPMSFLRLISILFSIIIFGAISNEGYSGSECIAKHSCAFGIFAGVLTFLVLIVSIGVDIYSNKVTNMTVRNWIIVFEFLVSVIGTLLHFVTFCFLVNSWTYRNEQYYKDVSQTGIPGAISFCFFSIGTFGAMSFFSWNNYKESLDIELTPAFENFDINGGGTDATNNDPANYQNTNTDY